MNSPQRTVIIIGVAVVLIMGLIPPWMAFVDSEGGYLEFSLGYSPIFSPPVHLPSTTIPSISATFRGRPASVSLDVTRLAVQWITVCLVTIGLSLALRTTERKERE